MELPEGYRNHLDGILHCIGCMVDNPNSNGLAIVYLERNFRPVADRIEAEGFDVSEYRGRAERLRQRHAELRGKC